MQCLQSALKPGKDFNNINVAEGYSAFYRVAAKGLTQEIEYRAERPVWPIIPVPVLNFLQPLSTEVSDMTVESVVLALLSVKLLYLLIASFPPPPLHRRRQVGILGKDGNKIILGVRLTFLSMCHEEGEEGLYFVQ